MYESKLNILARRFLYAICLCLFCIPHYAIAGTVTVGFKNRCPNPVRAVLYCITDSCGVTSTQISSTISAINTGNTFTFDGTFSTGTHCGDAQERATMYCSTNNNTTSYVKCIEGPQMQVDGGTILFTFIAGGNPNDLTNATYAASVYNPRPYDVMGYWADNGVAQHNEIIHPGQTVTYDIAYNPNTDTINFGYTVLNPNTTYNPSDGTLTYNLTTQTNSNGTYYGTNGYSGGNSTTNSVFYNPNNWYDQATNGTINFNGTSATAAKDDTLKAGFNQLAAGQTAENGLLGVLHQDLSTIHLDLGTVDEDIRHLGTNGISVTVTNAGGSGTNTITITNNIVALNTNDVNMYNDIYTNRAFVDSQAASGGGSNAAQPFINNWNAIGVGTLLSGPSLPSEGDWSVSAGTIPTFGTLTISSAAIPGHDLFALAKLAIAWSIYLRLLVLLLKWAEVSAIDKLMNQRQAQGSAEELWGFNASLGTAIVYASLIAVLVATIPTALAVVIGNSTSGMGAAATGMASLSSNVGWQMATTIFPFGVFITAFLSYCVFRWVVGLPLIVLMRMVIVFLLV